MERRPLWLRPRASHPAVTRRARRGGDRPFAHWPGYYTYGINQTSNRCLPLHSCTLMSHVVKGRFTARPAALVQVAVPLAGVHVAPQGVHVGLLSAAEVTHQRPGVVADPQPTVVARLPPSGVHLGEVFAGSLDNSECVADVSVGDVRDVNLGGVDVLSFGWQLRQQVIGQPLGTGVVDLAP